MKTSLYVETNLLLSSATGRDPASAALIDSPDPDITIVIPSCCIMEALSTLEGFRKRQREAIGRLGDQINEAKRNVISAHARSLASLLQQSVIHSKAAFDEFEARLFDGIEKLSASAERVDSGPEVIARSLRVGLIDDPTDNLILTTILDHAERRGPGRRALLTENRRDFGDNRFARSALDAAGIKYFAEAAKFLQWHRAGPEE